MTDATMRPRLRPLALAALALALVPSAADGGPRNPIRLRPPRRGVQLRVGPVSVPRADEATGCTYLKVPGRRDLAVNRVRIEVAGGSHHVHLYRGRDATVQEADREERCDFQLDFDRWQLVLASQTLRVDWRLPPGVAFHFAAGRQLVAQTHFVDTGLLATPEGRGWAVFNLYTVPKRKVVAYAGGFFGQDRDVLVPPRSTSTATTRCLFPKPVKLLAVTGHYHYRGTRFTASILDAGGEREIYTYEGYDDPPFVRFDEGQTPAMEGIAWTCTYENPDERDYRFGPFTDTNEHCNLFAFYYPTATPDEGITCIQENAVSRVVVRGS